MHRLLRTAAAVATGTALTFTVFAASELPASAAAGCKTTFTTYKTIKKGAKGTQAKAAQCLINRAGYSVKADGSFSSADSAQLKKFQRDHHVNVTGKVYASSWVALISRGSKPTLEVGDKGASVKRLQNSLNASNHRVKATGTYSTSTGNAVKAVQKAARLKVTGTTTASVWTVLQAGDPIAKKSGAKKPVAAKGAKSSKSSSSRAAKAVRFAKRQIGDRYRYGASGPGSWDCSGLTRGAWKSAGKKLPHSARQQYKKGKKVSKSSLRPGDLVFYYRGISHVGIYVGKGKIVHASRPGKPVGYAKLNSMPYQGARRVG
jgi:cell wall-associated NlpC family hydrolase